MLADAREGSREDAKPKVIGSCVETASPAAIAGRQMSGDDADGELVRRTDVICEESWTLVGMQM